MWHEALSDRGADQIASCLVHFLKDLPEHVNKVVLYSDSCSAENKNNTVIPVTQKTLTAYYKKCIKITYQFLAYNHRNII